MGFPTYSPAGNFPAAWPLSYRQSASPELHSRPPAAGMRRDLPGTRRFLMRRNPFTKTVLRASRKRVYEALTETKRFDKIIELTGVMKSMPPGGTQRRIFA